MNKHEYLDLLNQSLAEYDVDQKDIDDVLLDYNQMYDDALEKGLLDDEVYRLLGEPHKVINELRDTLTLKRKTKYKNKFISLTPFLAVIIFMLVGLTTGTYHPTWLIFLIIPMSAIILSGKNTFFVKPL